MSSSLPLQDISSLNAQHLLSLLDSPQNDVAEEVRQLIKGEFANVRDRWLVSGLLEYFLATNSKRLLDLLLRAPEPHDKFLLDKLYEGLKSQDRFQYSSLLLYSVTQNPPPMWIFKIPSHPVIKEIINILCHSKDVDASAVVCCTLVLVFILPAMPTMLAKNLEKILECFLRLLHWAPSKEADAVFKPYLQVAVYSLFHRLYSLFPCNLLTHIRRNTIDETHKMWFINTLRPMMERVRLHPLLFTETKDSEISKKRWVGLEMNDVMHECAKFCLDPLEETCEETSDIDVGLESLGKSYGNFICNQIESSFWSPSAVPSPCAASLPATPIYTATMMSNRGCFISESPPEPAIEATPDTTPFTSPLKLDCRLAASKRTVSSLRTTPTSLTAPLSPKKDPLMDSFFHKAEKSNLLSCKLHQIQKDLEVVQKETHYVLAPTEIDAEPLSAKGDNKQTTGGVHWKDAEKADISPKIIEEKQPVNFDLKRRRKASVYELFMEPPTDDDSAATSAEVTPLPEKSSDDGDDSTSLRRDSSSSQIGSEKDDEGLGVPSHKSMNDLVRSVKTVRLRFLSQFGPPPNISLLLERGTDYSKSEFNKLTKKSKSYPDLSNIAIFESSSPKKELTFSSPTRPPIETIDNSSQTVEAPVFDPYEKLLEALMLSQKAAQNTESIAKESVSGERPTPHDLLEELLQRECSVTTPLNSELGWNNIQVNEEKTKTYLRIMHSVMTVERYKRDVHAERNRRLFAKIKKLNLLKTREDGLQKEMLNLKRELDIIKQNSAYLLEKDAKLENSLMKMVPESVLEDLAVKEKLVRQQKEHLRETCAALFQEKQSITAELERCQRELRDKERHLKLNAKHADENKQLQKEVEVLQKKLLLMGELQEQLKYQMGVIQIKRAFIPFSKLEEERVAAERRTKEVEAHGRDTALKLEAAELRIIQLEKDVALKDEALLKESKKVQSVTESWTERCEALSKRNEALCNINITQMRELQGRAPTQERAPLLNGAGGKEPVSTESGSGSGSGSQRRPHSPIEIPTLASSSFLARESTERRLPSPSE